MAINLEVSKDRVLLEVIADEEVTPGGIIITGVHTDMPGKAKIVKVYTGPDSTKSIFKVGDTVLYNKNNKIDILIEGKKYLLTREVDCYCRFKK